MNPPKRLLVISPHLDDAVLSCGALLAAFPRSVVCTVFAGSPAEKISTDWDRASGFADAAEAIEARQVEDAQALRVLSASALHLPFCDAQYNHSASLGELIDAIEQIIRGETNATVLVPMGLFHSDHVMVSDACLQATQRLRHEAVVAYEDVPYRNIDGTVQERLHTLMERGVVAQPIDHLWTAAIQHDQMKRSATDAYQSQLRAFGPNATADLAMPERYWHIQHQNMAPN